MTALPKILIAEDDASFADTLRLEFSERGYESFVIHCAAEICRYQPETFDYALVDLRLGRDSGIDLVSYIHSLNPRCQIVMLTGFGSIATAIKAVKSGAVNYLTKPASISQIEAALKGSDAVAVPAVAPQTAPSLARHEREYIETVLSECQGNVSRAARVLGLHRQSLQRKLRKFTPR